MESFFLEEKYLKTNEHIESYTDLNKKANFADFLEFICNSDKLNIAQQNNILMELRDKLIIYLLNNNQYLDEYIIANLLTFQKIYSAKNQDKDNNISSVIKFINFVKIFTLNINITSQIMSNLVILINTIIDFYLNKSNNNYSITDDNVFPILKLVQLNNDICININSYNPRLIVFISQLLTYIFSIKNEKEYKNYKTFFPELKKSKSIKEFLYITISDILNNFNSNMKSDINYDIIFNSIYNDIINYINKSKEYKKYFEAFINDYNENIQKIKNKKNMPMNYLLIKRKSLPSLEPDYDLSFLGDYPEFVNKEEKQKKLNDIIKHKVRNTEKQAIRKLKKEGRIIDNERQKVIDRINAKRKEDMKFVNQYLEQQNIEYKKMMSSNVKRRFKFHKKNKK